MNKAEAMDRDRARDAIRADAYASAVEHGSSRALVLVPEHYLPMLALALKKFYPYRLGPGARSDHVELLQLLREEMNDHQRIDVETIWAADAEYVAEWLGAKE